MNYCLYYLCPIKKLMYEDIATILGTLGGVMVSKLA